MIRQAASVVSASITSIIVRLLEMLNPSNEVECWVPSVKQQIPRLVSIVRDTIAAAIPNLNRKRDSVLSRNWFGARPKGSEAKLEVQTMLLLVDY